MKTVEELISLVDLHKRGMYPVQAQAKESYQLHEDKKDISKIPSDGKIRLPLHEVGQERKEIPVGNVAKQDSSKPECFGKDFSPRVEKCKACGIRIDCRNKLIESDIV